MCDEKEPYLCDRCRQERAKQFLAAQTRWFLMAAEADMKFVWRPSALFVEVNYV